MATVAFRSTAASMVCAAALLAAMPSNGLQVVRTVPSNSRGGGRIVRFPSPHPIGTKTRHRRADAAAASRRSPPLTTLHLLKGLVPTVDDDLNRELEEANLTLYELFKRELEEGASIPAAIKAVMKRKKDKAGDYENKYKILSDYRSYSNRELLDTDHLEMAPVLDDLNQLQPSTIKTLWVTGPYRLAVFLSAFFTFPLFCNILSSLVEVSEDEFDIINDQFTPGIGILYGTFVALTLDILYERQGKVQENASVEASLLSQVTQNALNLFRDNTQIAREACQIVADQVRIIVFRERGSEMLNIMRADPYARLLSIVDHYQRDKKNFTPHEEALIDGLRGEIPALMEARAKRLSDEASALPPTHFLVLLVLTALSLVGFTAATLTITDADGNPPLESRMCFAGLSAVYVLFFNFCKDMNDPFDGVYQIKRSSTASYLLQIKWLIANQPFGKDIKFDTRGLAPVYDGNEVVEIGKDALKVELSPSDDATVKPSAVLADDKKEPDPQQEAQAAISMETSTSAPGVSFTKEPSKAAKVNVVVSKTSSAKAYLPKRKENPSGAVMQRQSKNSQDDMVSQFGAASLDCTEDGRVERLQRMQDELEGLKQLKAYLPKRKENPPDSVVQRQSMNTQDDMVSQFESLSGFSGDKKEGGGVTVPAKKVQGSPVDKQKISMYFRKTGGFGE